MLFADWNLVADPMSSHEVLIKLTKRLPKYFADMEFDLTGEAGGGGIKLVQPD